MAITDNVYVLLPEEHGDHSEMLKEVRNLLAKNAKHDTFEALVMVDALEKLCIDYHFQEEIGSILDMLCIRITNDNFCENDQSLHSISLCFRILRQKGYHVPAEVFDNFKTKEGKFKEEITRDVEGLMALYEASQLRIEGEGILEEAADFSSTVLNEIMPFLGHDQVRMVKYSLDHSYQKSSPVFMVKNFMKDYEGSLFSELAQLDFEIVQSIRQREVHQVSRWWKDLGLAQELKLARNQPLKWYIWPMAGLTNPILREQRLELTKPIALVFLIDDIYDVYGNLGELIIFTEAVRRWDITSIEQLPQYLRICFEALYNVTHEIAHTIHKWCGYNPIEYLKKTWATLCDAFLVEAKWFASGHLPTAEEYLNNAIISTGVPVIGVHLFFLLGGGTSNESASIIDNNQCIISCVAKILRLWDDLGSAEDENQDGHDGSYVTYYMKENKGCSLEFAHKHVMDMISDTWKLLNKESLSHNPFSAIFTKAWLNLARTIPLMYDYDENHSRPLLEEFIKSMF